MPKIISGLVVWASSLLAHANPVEVALYEGDIPLSKPHQVQEHIADCFGVLCAYNVVTPTVTVYKANTDQPAPMVLIFAGGGYSVQAIFHEGADVAKVFVEQGVHAAVVKYRLPNKAISDVPEKLPITDAISAAESIEKMAKDIEISKLGVMGFSAGSHLATDISLARPDLIDFSLLVYGVTVPSESNLTWLKNDLFKRELTSDEKAYYDFVGRVSNKTPATFLVHSIDDDVCHYHETTKYYEALLQNDVHAEMHLFATGGHGFGLGRAKDGTDQWPTLAANFIKRLDH